MITCPKCGKDNQDHYKFCLGCGAELPRDASPKPFAPQPPAGLPAAGPAPVAPVQGAPGKDPALAPRIVADPFAMSGPAPAVTPRGGSPQAIAPSSASGVPCPACGHQNAATNMFCGACGYRLVGQPLPGSKLPPAPAAPPPGSGFVLTALRADGSEAGSFAIPTGSATIGRETGSIFAGDSYLSPRHATFRAAGTGKAVVRDEGSLNGVYRKLLRDMPAELRPNDVFRIGQEIIRFEPLSTNNAATDGVERLGSPSKGYVGRIALVIGREETGNAFPIPEAGIHLGRERGDVLFPEDGYVSGLHCRLNWDGARLFLTDLGSSNGTFLRIREETEIRTGDVLLMGQQLFRVSV